jgi:hypothetical protein
MACSVHWRERPGLVDRPAAQRVDMATAAPSDPGRTTPRSATPVERRDLTTRALRNAVAAWFSIHPSALATLDGDTVERMALRLEGRRPHRSLPGLGSVCPIPEGRHPWAG